MHSKNSQDADGVTFWKILAILHLRKLLNEDSVFSGEDDSTS